MDAVFGEGQYFPQTYALMFCLLTQSDSIEERLDEEEEMEEEELERLALLSGRRRTLSLPFNYGAIRTIPKPAGENSTSPGLVRSSSWAGPVEQQPLLQDGDSR